jgi:hypothetical protein
MAEGTRFQLGAAQFRRPGRREDHALVAASQACRQHGAPRSQSNLAHAKASTKTLPLSGMVSRSSPTLSARIFSAGAILVAPAYPNKTPGKRQTSLISKEVNIAVLSHARATCKWAPEWVDEIPRLLGSDLGGALAQYRERDSLDEEVAARYVRFSRWVCHQQSFRLGSVQRW